MNIQDYSKINALLLFKTHKTRIANVCITKSSIKVNPLRIGYFFVNLKIWFFLLQIFETL